jgi:hypothetical protein
MAAAGQQSLPRDPKTGTFTKSTGLAAARSRKRVEGGTTMGVSHERTHLSGITGPA